VLTQTFWCSLKEAQTKRSELFHGKGLYYKEGLKKLDSIIITNFMFAHVRDFVLISALKDMVFVFFCFPMASNFQAYFVSSVLDDVSTNSSVNLIPEMVATSFNFQCIGGIIQMRD
jgi:hypothetical protein